MTLRIRCPRNLGRLPQVLRRQPDSRLTTRFCASDLPQPFCDQKQITATSYLKNGNTSASNSSGISSAR
jgi:hypothetical protein